MARRISVEIVGDSRSLERAFKRSGAAAGSFSSTMGKAAKGFAAGAVVAGGAAVALGVKSVSLASDFETSMSRVVGLAGQSQRQVAVWSDQLLALGPQLGKGPRELARALYFVASSGVPAGKALSIVAASAKASAAGMGETEVVADAVTSAMNAYGAANMSAARATDVLVATVREGKGEAAAFAPVIGNVTAFASRLKVAFEEVGAGLAAMTQLGTDPATAATQLQTFFSQLLKPTAKAEKAASRVGISFDELRDTLSKRGLLAVLGRIKKAFAGNTTQLAQSFPNIRALRALLALTADDGGKVAGVFERLGASSGSLDAAFEAVRKSSEHNINAFKASIESLQIAFGQGLLPMVTKVAKVLATKLMDPAFVANVRKLGREVGDKLLKAFEAIGEWFQDHWNEIKSAFRTGAELAGKLAVAAEKLYDWFKKIASVTPGGAGTLLGVIVGGVLIAKLAAIATSLKLIQTRLALLAAGPWVIAISLVLLNKDAIDAWVQKKLGRLYGGGTLNIKTPADWAKAPDWVKKAFIAQGGKPPPGGKSIPRAHGGPVMPGFRYRVGEHGPETFVPSRAGTIVPNGAGGMSIDTVHVHGVQNVRELIDELQRYARHGAAQTRGRHGGQNLALG